MNSFSVHVFVQIFGQYFSEHPGMALNTAGSAKAILCEFNKAGDYKEELLIFTK